MDKRSVPDDELTRKDGRPSPTDFDNYLPWACFELSVDATIIITRSVQSHYVGTVKDRPKPKAKLRTKATTDSFSEVGSLTTDDAVSATFFKGIIMAADKPVYIETVYDDCLDLVQIKFQKNNKIPREVMKVIGLIIPFHKSLSSIIINTGLNAEAVYELSKFLPSSRITEICLDYTSLVKVNYHILLDNDVLKHLSLSKCNINDAVVEMLASKLAISCPASKTLSVLNLATNRITDEGVKYLAKVLRTNRQLSYLNLSDNLITDEGANSIFSILEEFALTRQESLDRSNKRMEYLRAKSNLILKTVKDLQIGDFDRRVSRRKSARPLPLVVKKKLLDKDISLPTEGKSMPNIEAHFQERAENIVDGILGPFNDPFGVDNTVKREGVEYCLGNNSLSYLNLAYNNLTHFSLKKLCNVLVSQNILNRKPKGLINVRIEGNFMPEFCAELKMINDLLESGLALHRRMSDVSRKKTPSSKASSKRIM